MSIFSAPLYQCYSINILQLHSVVQLKNYRSGKFLLLLKYKVYISLIFCFIFKEMESNNCYQYSFEEFLNAEPEMPISRPHSMLQQLLDTPVESKKTSTTITKSLRKKPSKKNSIDKFNGRTSNVSPSDSARKGALDEPRFPLPPAVPEVIENILLLQPNITPSSSAVCESVSHKVYWKQYSDYMRVTTANVGRYTELLATVDVDIERKTSYLTYLNEFTSSVDNNLLIDNVKSGLTALHNMRNAIQQQLTWGVW